jgi:hypothetical protein
MLLDWSPRWVWGVSGSVGLAAMALLSPRIIRRAIQMRQYPGFNQSANAINYALFIGAVIGFFGSALGMPTSNPFLAYFGSIVALLTSCAILFFRVIASLLQPSAADSE